MIEGGASVKAGTLICGSAYDTTSATNLINSSTVVYGFLAPDE